MSSQLLSGGVSISHSAASNSANPWTAANQAPLSMELSRQEHQNGQPFPSPGDLPDPGIEPRSPSLQADSLPAEPPEKPKLSGKSEKKKKNLLSLKYLLADIAMQILAHSSPECSEHSNYSLVNGNIAIFFNAHDLSKRKQN